MNVDDSFGIMEFIILLLSAFSLFMDLIGEMKAVKSLAFASIGVLMGSYEFFREYAKLLNYVVEVLDGV